MNNTLLITGATSDVGYEYLKHLKENEKKIIALYYDYEERLEELEKVFKLDIERVQVNFLDIEETKNKVKEMSEKYNITEVLHLAAPQVNQQRFNKVETEVFLNDYYIQVVSIVEILKVILPKMKKNRHGKVVFMLSSCVLNIPPKFWTSYVTNKYALLGLMKALVSEYRDYNIRFNSISPSMIETKFIETLDSRIVEQMALNNPLKRNLKSEDIIKIIEFLLDDASDNVNGVNLGVTGGENY